MLSLSWPWLEVSLAVVEKNVPSGTPQPSLGDGVEGRYSSA